MNLRPSADRPLVIGHRGACAVAPENTLASLAAAVAARAALVEFDVSPGLRLAHSVRELRDDAIGIDEALDFLRAHDVGVHLDVKLPGYEVEVVQMIRRHALEERALVSTAFPGVARALARAGPRITRAIGYPRDRYGISRAPWPAGLTHAGAAALRAVMPVRIPLLLRSARAGALALHHTLCSRAAVAAAHRFDAAVLAWTVNDSYVARRLAEIGVDAIVTDDPALVLDAFEDQAGATLTRP